MLAQTDVEGNISCARGMDVYATAYPMRTPFDRKRHLASSTFAALCSVDITGVAVQCAR